MTEDPPHATGVAGSPLAVLVVVGTDIHPFDRLMSWLEEWYASHPDRPRLLVQHGCSRAPRLPATAGAGAAAVPYLGHVELQRVMAEALLVVSHGGPATITEARRAGHLPLVVPRDPGYGEHVDAHQQLFARRLAGAGMVRLCGSGPELAAALTTGLADPAGFRLASDLAGQAGRAQAVARVGAIVDGLVAAAKRR